MDLDDSENDSDYVPEDDGVEAEVTAASKKKTIATDVNPRKKRLIDELFLEMQEEDKKFISDNVTKTSMLVNPVVLERPTKRLKKRADRYLSKFLQQSRNNNSSECDLALNKVVAQANVGNIDMKKLAAEAAAKVAKKTVVTEVRKFAGSEITIEKTVSLSKGGSSSSSAPPKPDNSGLDKVLDMIKGPKAISTVVKSATDWDNYKEKEGIELDQAAKDGYLGKKEFLERCDVRSFEKERDQRIANKAKE